MAQLEALASMAIVVYQPKLIKVQDSHHFSLEFAAVLFETLQLSGTRLGQCHVNCMFNYMGWLPA